MKIGNREFQTKGHTYVMGILNVTPDSFSDGGKWNDRDRALKHVWQDYVSVVGSSARTSAFFRMRILCMKMVMRRLFLRSFNGIPGPI